MGKIKLDINQEVTGRLPFIPFKEFNDLCVGKLTDVEKTTTTSKDDANWEFAGKEIPMLSFRFTQFKKNANDKDRFMTMSFTPISNQKSDGVERTASALEVSYKQMFQKIKHLHDQYAGNENFASWTVPVEFDTELDVDGRLAEFTAFFDAVVKAFNNGKDGQNPVYNKDQYLTIVMIASGNKKSYLALPDFVGKGIFDIFKSKNGKIDTYLTIPPNETVELGLGNVAATPMGASNATADVPDVLKGLVD